jgi:hypothetical protein
MVEGAHQLTVVLAHEEETSVFASSKPFVQFS